MQKDNRLSPFIIICFLTALRILSGCSLDYSSAKITEDLSEKVPETVFINFSRVKVKDGKIINTIEAGRAENYTKKKEMILSEIKFREFDENGTVLTEGKADRALLYTDTEDADIYGNIYFYSHTEQTAIMAETLFWKQKEQRLFAEPGELIRVKKDNGSFMAGRGFTTDFRLKEISFSNGVNGLFIREDEGDK